MVVHWGVFGKCAQEEDFMANLAKSAQAWARVREIDRDESLGDDGLRLLATCVTDLRRTVEQLKGTIRDLSEEIDRVRSRGGLY